MVAAANGGCLAVLAQEETTTFFNQAGATYQIDTNSDIISTLSNSLEVNATFNPPPPPETTPVGVVTRCDRTLFDDYRGFTVALYEATGPLQTDLGPLVALDPNATLPLIPDLEAVNPENQNPFDLGNTETFEDPNLRGRYNFRFRPDQVFVGKTFILMAMPAPGNFVDERLIQIRITAVTEDSLSYTVMAMDGQPVGAVDSLEVSRATQTKAFQKPSPKVSPARAIDPRSLLAVRVPLCQQQAIAIQKTADRATVEPGGIAIYRLGIRNRSTTTLSNVEVRDRLPLGFQLIEDSVQGVIGDNPAALETQVNGRDITFTFQEPLPGGEPPENNPLARIVYAVEITPDALRGDGRNVVFVEGDRQDNNFTVRDGPAVYAVGIRNGLLSDLGTIIGRVFEDKNFDGEQQYGEPGIPNAIVFMENGNRIVTDENGLFSVANVLPGWHTGVLDLTSVPGYAPAPNEKFIAEDRTYSRTVRLEPGGMARMNFAVTPFSPGGDE